MKFSTLKEAIQFRITEDEEKYWVVAYWEKAIQLFTANISETIEFVLHECSDEEFYWLSEIFEQMAVKTQSKELIQAFRERLGKVQPENYNKQNFKSEHMRKYVDYDEYIRDVSQEIEYAEGSIRD